MWQNGTKAVLAEGNKFVRSLRRQVKDEKAEVIVLWCCRLEAQIAEFG